jgi:phage host-nuclease inhibitor protein Gam
MKKEKFPIVEIQSFTDVDALLLELGQLTATIAEEEAEMNRKIQEARERYARQTEQALLRKSQLEKTIEQYCIANKDKFEKQRKLELTHGVIGFQTNPPKVVMLNRKYNENTVLELLKKLRLSRFIRIKEQIDKEALIATYLGKEIDDAKLASVGLRIEQTETFICEPKWEEIAMDVTQ